MSNPTTDSSGNKCWFNSKSELHRLDGPAIEFKSGTTWWCVAGKRHRLDGPAIEYADGTKQWWVNDIRVTESEYLQAVLLYKCKQVLES